MVFIERLYNDWDDEEITKLWVDQSTVDCCKSIDYTNYKSTILHCDNIDKNSDNYNNINKNCDNKNCDNMDNYNNINKNSDNYNNINKNSDNKNNKNNDNKKLNCINNNDKFDNNGHAVRRNENSCSTS
jgi:hypothetical protein